MQKLDHTFVIMAYKESPYLEECIKSVVAQSLRSDIILSTSTPNEHIKLLSKKYNLPLFVNNGEGDIIGNWNFAFSLPETSFVTLCHQDDIYGQDYLKEISKYFSKDVLILHTAWYCLKNNVKTQNLCIKFHKFLNFIAKIVPSSARLRKFVLSFGMSIKTPSICYHKAILPQPLWSRKYNMVFDWEAISKIAKLKGRFIYINKPLFLYRISAQAASYDFTNNGVRKEEDFSMFCSFWPKYIARFIHYFYRKSYNVYVEK